MSPANLGILLVAVALAACGQVLLKHGMTLATGRSEDRGQSLVVAAATSPWVIGGLAVFAVSAVAWLLTLSRVPLSIAYPFNALGYVAILVASAALLGERATLGTWLGTVLVVVGLIVVVSFGGGSS